MDKEFKNPETKAKYRMVRDNWGRKVHIPSVWAGKIENIPPHAVEAYIAQGCKYIVPIQDTAPAANPKSKGEKETTKPE